MRRLLFLVLLLAACSPVARPLMEAPILPAPTEVGGVLTGETVLSGDCLLVSDLLIPAGSRLVLRAGTTLRVRRAETTKIDPEFLSSLTEILVRGTLQIEGTADAPVKITPETPARVDDPAWAGILLDGASDAWLSYLQISGAETGLLSIDSTSRISDAVFTANRYGLVVQGGSPRIERTLIADGEAGCFFWRGATPQLQDVSVVGNAEEGISIDRSCRPLLQHVRSQRNAIGLVAVSRPAPGEVQLQENTEDWRMLPVAAGGTR